MVAFFQQLVMYVDPLRVRAVITYDEAMDDIGGLS
jgi:hypothetical protein